jgi:hypothetical protein
MHTPETDPPSEDDGRAAQPCVDEQVTFVPESPAAAVPASPVAQIVARVEVAGGSEVVCPP